MNTQRNSDSDEIHTGFRLHRFEVLNWGTFHKHIWQLPPLGANSLLTGDIGSGKSTLVDGLTTLLVSPRKIVYNKAAGADTKERSLRSYVRGYYKSEKDSDTLAAKSVALRDANNYTVLLANFFNQGYDQSVTLAQVFWNRDHRNPPERFYLVAAKTLRIKESFGGFGNDVLDLKKRLRKEKDVRLFESFAQYATAFRRRMAISNDQALELFYQTVSLKSVGNLTDFVRRHMLEEPPVKQRVSKICHQFDDLNNAHEAVVKAKEQVDMLTPLVDDHARLDKLKLTIGNLETGRDSLRAFFARKKILLYGARLRKRKEAKEKLVARIGVCRKDLLQMRNEQRRLDRSISESGGRRLEELTTAIEQFTVDRRRIADKADIYRKQINALKMRFPASQSAFIDNRNHALKWKKKLTLQHDEILNRHVELNVRQKELNDQIKRIEDELNSLKKRKTNISIKTVLLRQSLCKTLGITEDELPFVGELLRIKPGEDAWQGVAERLLHNFGLSLLVPAGRYGKVAEYVENTHLNGRLVYYKVPVSGRRSDTPPEADSLLRKLEIKPDTPFYDYLERELALRFDYTCCDSLKEFRRFKNALTAKGQIKSGGIRHEKDDRYHIDDRSRYILGWDNHEKIRILKGRLEAILKDHQEVAGAVKALDSDRRKIENARDILQNILGFETFAEIYWQPLAQKIQQLIKEKEQIEQSSDVLATLERQLETVIADIDTQENLLGKLQAQWGKLQEGIDLDQKARTEAVQELSELSEEIQKELFPQLDQVQAEALGSVRISVENCNANKARMRDWLQRKINNETAKFQRLSANIIRAMQAYKSRYPVETKEMDAALESMDEFVQMLDQLKQEDLPRHENRFKTMLNEGTIQNIALFQAKLDKELTDIKAKIEIINRSLSSIDYGNGTYITLVADPGLDVEIRQFKEDLRACLGDTLAGSREDVYTENKFIQVKAIIDRFNGRQGQVDIDKRWTQKVTDVRNWLVFSVSEKWREDDKEKEFYSDTAGKSGGQKEKLAYTILASALAYQFGLKWGEKKSKSLRFVMIDEAFGRGSDDSSRYALELFKRLNLQLLIVTPLQKINIIEDFVRSVHFVHNQGGKNSMVRNLTIEEYREEKAVFQESAA